MYAIRSYYADAVGDLFRLLEGTGKAVFRLFQVELVQQGLEAFAVLRPVDSYNFV